MTFGRPRNWAWLGLVPYLGYALVCFVLPIVVLLRTAFQDTVTGAVTGANVGTSLHGAYLTGLQHSIVLSLVDALLVMAASER